ncbi:facilitated trehalose transporter Tret1-like isoform X1 [Musca autumnalis]|uniref:facilitated trehalose transporter Tret1-like isoform X1 n=1 Tax=Musca autumnalis TaxID=221902 RepID=UPI003CEBA1B1
MSSDEPQIKYQEVSPFQISEGFTNSNSRSHTMEPVKTGRIFLAAIAANLSAFAVGTCLGWTSPVTPKLKTEDTSDSPLDAPIDSSDEAWISSIVALGALVVPFFAGPLADRIGRKWLLLYSSTLLIVGYIILMVGRVAWVLLVARLINGFGAGFIMTALPMYLAEIATDNLRGATGSLMNLFIVAGILYCYSIGPYVSYQVLQWCCLALPIVFMICYFFMPESPYYLVSKNRKDDALKSLQFLRGQSLSGVQQEMSQIEKFLEESNATKGSPMDLFKLPGNRKALLITTGLLILQQLSGINAVQINSQSIFADAGSTLDPAIATILIGTVQVGSSIIIPIIADRVGRRIILITSSSIMAMALAALGAFFYVKRNSGNVDNILWLPIVVLVIHMIFYCISFGALPWAILGEMIPPNLKYIAAPIATSLCLAAGFGSAFVYPYLDAMGTHYVFWIFAGFCVLAFFFSFFVVIETRGLSLPQIQDKLSAKKM